MKKLSAVIILEKINILIPDYRVFEIKLANHIRENHFPILYQHLYPYLTFSEKRKLRTDDFKMLLHRNCLRLLNDIYKTRLSEDAFDEILKRLDRIDDFTNYRIVLNAFENCNPRKTGDVNALSLGTKVLHTYAPNSNPILDIRIRQRVLMNASIDINMCCVFKEAMNSFADAHESYFAIEKSSVIVEVLRHHRLTPYFPRMKILDMVLLEEP